MSLTPTSKKKIAIAVAVLGSVSSLFSIFALLDHPARLVDLITLFGSAFGAGAGVVAAIRRSA